MRTDRQNNNITFLSESYSPDGQTQLCLRCPTGYIAKEEGATSADQCTGIETSL